MTEEAKNAWDTLRENLSAGCRRVREGVESRLTVSRTIPHAAASMDGLLGSLRARYEGLGYDCQIFGYEEDGRRGRLLQVRNTTGSYLGAVKTVAGLRAAVCIACLPDGPDLSVRIFGSQWLEKMAVNVVSWFVLHPLFVTSAIGGWRQKALVDTLDREVLAFFAHATEPEKPGETEGGGPEEPVPLLEAPEDCRW